MRNWKTLTIPERIELTMRIIGERILPEDTLPEAEMWGEAWRAEYERLKGDFPFSTASKMAKIRVIASILEEKSTDPG